MRRSASFIFVVLLCVATLGTGLGATLHRSIDHAPGVSHADGGCCQSEHATPTDEPPSPEPSHDDCDLCAVIGSIASATPVDGEVAIVGGEPSNAPAVAPRGPAARDRAVGDAAPRGPPGFININA